MKAVPKVRLKDKRRRASYTVLAVYGLLTVAVLGGIAYTSRLPQFTVQTVKISGAQHVSEESVRAVVDEKLHGTYGLLIPKRLSYVVPAGTLTAAVLDAFPVVQSVLITRLSVTELALEVTERVPYALWCSVECYRMDEYGFIFDTAKPTDTLIHYSGGEHAVGGEFMHGAFHDFSRFVTLVSTIAGQDVTEVRVSGTDAFIKLSSHGEIRLLTDADLHQTGTMLRALFASSEFQEEKKLEYIELRFGKNAVVKFRD